MYKKGGISPQVIGRMKRDLSSTCEELSCSFDIIYSDSNISISRISYYDNYPIHHFVKNDVNVIVEGYLFQHLDGNPMQRLREMAEPAEVTISGLAKEIGDFVDRTDGEFVVTLYNQRTGDMAVFNDILGRLPTYFFSGPDSFILSREVKFIAAMMPEPVLSAHAAAQSLVFHFPLGDRTLLRDVKRMMPANLIVLESKNQKLRRYRLFDWNLSVHEPPKPAKRLADELVDLYLDGTRSRLDAFKDRKSVLALSGGLDSRTVLAALMHVDSPFTPITFIDQRGLHLKDVKVAKEIADILGLELNVYDLPGMDLDKMNELVYLKDGLSANGIMGTVLQSHEIIVREYGNGIVYYTGAGGGLILAPRCPLSSIRDNELTGKIINRNAMFSPESASAILRMDPRDFRNRLAEYFHNYPEDKREDKYGHFMIFEHLLNFSFQGEDRERYYFWNNAPLYSSRFFMKTMRIHDSSKMNHVLFAEVLKALDPRLASIKYANWGFPITSPITPLYLSLKNMLLEQPRLADLLRGVRQHSQLIRKRRRVFSQDRDIPLLRENALGIIERDNDLKDFVDSDQIVRLLPSLGNIYSLFGINNLLTYISKCKTSLASFGVDPDS